ncbi:sugar dehydrogenase complex small subunit [Acidovorax soli]|uniref:sugar dehydrogenase complex small subunit n=1 Tax=Acidovorax soli TaxID=592050 RepID=UPI0032B230E4
MLQKISDRSILAPHRLTHAAWIRFRRRNAMQYSRRSPPFALQRRHVLGGALATAAAALLPWTPVFPVEVDADQAFLALSILLTGRDNLDPALGRRLRQALQSGNDRLDQHTTDLLGLLETRKVPLPDLQAILATEKAAFAALPGQIMTAWYLGVVGKGPQAKVLAFEHALNAVAVSDKLKPPTYAYGAPGSWSHNPNA